MKILKENWKWMGTVLILALCGFLMIANQQLKTSLNQTIEEWEQEQLRTERVRAELTKRLREQRDTVRTVTKYITRPDGSTEKVVDKTEEKIKVFQETTDKTDTKVVDENTTTGRTEVKVIKEYKNSHYRIGATYQILNEEVLPNVGLQTGMRLFGLPLWGDLYYQPMDGHEISLGVSYEF